MNTRHLLILHIHSCFASVSSGDKWLSRELDVNNTPFQPANYEKNYEKIVGLFVIDGTEWEVTEVVTYDGWIVYYTADREFYNKALHGRGFMDCFDLTHKVTAYIAQGWNEREPVDYIVVKEAHDANEKAQNTANRTAKGYLFPDYNTILPRAQMQGGLSDEVFNHPELIRYMHECEDGEYKGKVLCFGYVGNSNRLVELDRFLERHLRALGWTVKEIAVWLTSTDGRHMADAYEKPNDCLTWSFRNFAREESA